MFVFAFAFLVVLAFLCVAVVIGGIVVRSSTWSPAVLRPMSSSATFLARVDVCIARVARVGRVIAFLIWVFAFALPLAFLERESTCVRLPSSTHVLFPADTIRSKVFGKSNTISTELFEERHCWQSFASIMIFCIKAWNISAVYQTPCLCSVGFFNRSDKSSDTAFRDQNQRVIHLYAALQMCIAERLHGCQGDRISFDFASVHQLLRDCADEAHVDSVAEAKVLILCIVNIERRPLAQASQVLVQFGQL